MPLCLQVVDYLDTMCNDPLCKMASALNGAYLLNLQEMAAATKQLTLETAVQRKFGELACRLFRLLLLLLLPLVLLMLPAAC